MLFIYVLLFLVAAIKWGDWRRWRDFYPTILFFIVGDLLKNFLLYNHWLWTYKETIVFENIFRNHTIINIMKYENRCLYMFYIILEKTVSIVLVSIMGHNKTGGAYIMKMKNTRWHPCGITNLT